MALLTDLFGTSKPLIAMCHARAMPGRPLHDDEAGMRAIVEGLARDLDVLQAAEVDGLLFCNEQDLPYQLEVGPEVVAGMAAAIEHLLDLGHQRIALISWPARVVTIRPSPSRWSPISSTVPPATAVERVRSRSRSI